MKISMLMPYFRYISFLNVFSHFYILYSHMCVKIVFIALQALRRYKIPWAKKDLKMLPDNAVPCTA